MQSQFEEAKTTLKSIIRNDLQGCNKSTRVLISKQRVYFGGDTKSYHPYVLDNTVSLTRDTFVRNLADKRRNTLSPAIQWTRIQTFLLTRKRM